MACALHFSFFNDDRGGAAAHQGEIMTTTKLSSLITFTAAVGIFALTACGGQYDESQDDLQGDELASDEAESEDALGWYCSTCTKSTGSEKPELRATSPYYGYCEINLTGQLVVRVRNAGTWAAASSVTRVSFGSLGFVDHSTPSLAVGATHSFSVPIPAGCYDSDCNFSITVDLNGQVTELNETNNTVAGVCIG
jgi:hypothetical protein